MLQRRQVLLHTSITFKRSNFDHGAAQSAIVSPETGHIVSEQIANGDSPTANNMEKHCILKVMKEVKHNKCPCVWIISIYSYCKLVMRNQIRGLMIDKGLPNFYITINPADIYSPLIKFLARDEINLDSMTKDTVPKYFDQASLVAQNPAFAIAAQFFNLYMKAFISTTSGDPPI
ncbi:hypothetical protein B0H19DRAFT_963470 [Mycena capillaripes]|nr:hypothetical protein B0H19DRAFT_963470 [Mycena capillaripes]